MKDQFNNGTRYNFESLKSQLLPYLTFGPVDLLIDLLSTTHEVYQAKTDKLSQYGLSQGKFMILLMLFKHEHPLNPSELADYAGVTRSTVTGLTDGLEKDELIRRGALDDRRKTAIHLTEKGKKLMNTVIPLYVDHTTEIMSEITKEEQELLLTLLKKIRIGVDRSKNKS